MTASSSFSFLKIAAAAPLSSSSSRTHHHHHQLLPPPTYPSHYSSSSLTVRSYSQAEGPLRRPVAPSLPPNLREPTPPSVVAPPPQQSKASVKAEEGVIILEFQRQKAKKLQEYFREKKLLEADQGPFFGFLPKNEMANGRWAMFGFAVGMLTE